ncbi:hypothetical protein ACFZB5_32310 [Streptomyces nodosus]|uniref:hypothetical protein n=1 Tax=Streptomyces nodosus TaxID=40318 RepID=UPI0036EB6203
MTGEGGVSVSAGLQVSVSTLLAKNDGKFDVNVSAKLSRLVPLGGLMPTTARLPHRSSVIVICTVLGGFALTGYSGSNQADSPDRSAAPATTMSAASATSSGRTEHIAGESVTKPPKLLSGVALAQAASAKGNGELELGHITAQPLSVLVNCQGKGTLTVEVRPMGFRFPLECVASKVNTTYNELHLKQPREQGVVSVTAPSSVRWSLTVGQ